MGLYPKNLNEFVAGMGIPRGPLSKVYLVDPVNGSASNPGTSWQYPLLTVAAAYALCVADRHDVVLLLSGDTSDQPAAAINWSKDFTHLIGLGPEHYGVGLRSRMVGTAGNDLAQIITFSGTGCIVKNIQFFQGNDAAADSGAVIVSGSRNYFENVLFAGMGHATAGARAGSYSLKVTGSENTFKRCGIGLQTIVRAAANTELLMSGDPCYRNRFVDSEFLSWSVTAGKFLVKFDSTSSPWQTQFENCLFANLDQAAGGGDGASIDNAISDASVFKHHVILRGNLTIVGCTGVADVVTNIYASAPTPSVTAGLAVNPTT